MKYGPYLINTFSSEFFFFFYLFFQKLFHLLRILKTNCRLWSAVPDFLFDCINRFELAHQTVGPGGAPTPRLPSLIAKMCDKIGHSNSYRLCKLGITTNCRSENDSTFKTRNHNKKQKSHNFVIGTGLYRHICFGFFFAFFVFAISQPS